MRAIALTLALILAPALLAQTAPKEGDLIPRAGTLAYAISDRPDAVYQFFGRDPGGAWKLRSWAEAMREKNFAGKSDSKDAKQSKTILDYVFNTYESLSRVELGLLDVTMDGPKYLLLLHARQGKQIDIAPEFLKELVAATNEFHGIKYLEYRVPLDEKGGEEDGPKREPKMFGMDRYYVASLPSGVLISNFETSIRESIQRLATGDYSESLSGREEFKEWMGARKPHDLSIFLIGREFQNAIERVLPSKDQSGVDAPGIYRELDDWLQLREYRYLVFDLDYDEKARGFTAAGSFKTRRPTRLLEKLAIDPAEFKLLKYVPAGAVFTGGMQLGDAKRTFNNLKELAYDVENWADQIAEGFGKRGEAPLPPPDDKDKSIQPEEPEPEARDSEIDRKFKELDEMLAGYGTSLDEVLSVIGTEIVVCLTPDATRTKTQSHGSADIGDIFESATLGIALGLKDVEAARKLLANAREKDSKGAFRGFEEVEVAGFKANVSAEHPFGWAFTENALLICVVRKLDSTDAAPAVTAGLTALLQASRATTGPGRADRSFTSNCSRFIEMDVGAIARIETELSQAQSEKLDRYARPPLNVSPTSLMRDLTLAVRSREAKDGVEIAVRVAGLPDIWQYITGEASMIEGGEGRTRQNAYSYGESNLRALADALRKRVDADKPLKLDDMIEAREIRRGTLQLPLDKRWKGDLENLGWITLEQVVRDESGNLSEWVNKEAAAMIEANEASAFRSLKLADGDIAPWIKDYKAGFIVAYQEQPESLGGHMIIYADGQVGWLSASAFKEALTLNADGKPVPGDAPWGDSKPKPERESKPGPEGERLPDGDPWLPEKK